jgi:aminopeptidase N
VLLRGIQLFLAAPGARSVDDLRRALETAAGRSLEHYFNAWVWGDGEVEWPVFEVTTVQDGDATNVTVRQSHSAGVVFPCVVDVELRGATRSARARVEFPLDSTGSQATARVLFGEPVLQTRVDPDQRVLDWTVGSRGATSARIPWHP